MTEVNHFLASKCCCIIRDDLGRATKSGRDIGFYELYNNLIIGFPTRNGFYPLSEIVCGSENPSVLGRRWWMDFSYEIKPPLLKRGFNSDGM